MSDSSRSSHRTVGGSAGGGRGSRPPAVRAAGSRSSPGLLREVPVRHRLVEYLGADWRRCRRPRAARRTGSNQSIMP